MTPKTPKRRLSTQMQSRMSMFEPKGAPQRPPDFHSKRRTSSMSSNKILNRSTVVATTKLMPEKSLRQSSASTASAISCKTDREREIEEEQLEQYRPSNAIRSLSIWSTDDGFSSDEEEKDTEPDLSHDLSGIHIVEKDVAMEDDAPSTIQTPAKIPSVNADEFSGAYDKKTAEQQPHDEEDEQKAQPEQQPQSALRPSQSTNPLPLTLSDEMVLNFFEQNRQKILSILLEKGETTPVTTGAEQEVQLQNEEQSIHCPDLQEVSISTKGPVVTENDAPPVQLSPVVSAECTDQLQSVIPDEEKFIHCPDLQEVSISTKGPVVTENEAPPVQLSPVVSAECTDQLQSVIPDEEKSIHCPDLPEASISTKEYVATENEATSGPVEMDVDGMNSQKKEEANEAPKVEHLKGGRPSWAMNRQKKEEEINKAAKAEYPKGRRPSWAMNRQKKEEEVNEAAKVEYPKGGRPSRFRAKAEDPKGGRPSRFRAKTEDPKGGRPSRLMNGQKKEGEGRPSRFSLFRRNSLRTMFSMKSTVPSEEDSNDLNTPSTGPNTPITEAPSSPSESVSSSRPATKGSLGTREDQMRKLGEKLNMLTSILNEMEHGLSLRPDRDLTRQIRDQLELLSKMVVKFQLHDLEQVRLNEKVSRELMLIAEKKRMLRRSKALSKKLKKLTQTANSMCTYT